MEEASLSRFRQCLSPLDRRALDEIMNAAQRHLSSAAYAAHTLPIEIFFLAMLLEQHKAIQKISCGLNLTPQSQKSRPS